MADVVRVDRRDNGVVQLTMNRPDALNALDAVLVGALHSALRTLAVDNGVRAVVLTGEGRAFCAGLDLNGYGSPPGADLEEGRPQAGLRVQQHIAGLVDAFRSMRAPVIAAVNGAAAGGGLALALMADIRIVAEDAQLHAAFIRRGLSNCDIGMSWLLPRMIGFSRSAEIMLTGRAVDAAEAERIGIASYVVPPEALLDRAHATADAIVQHSPFGVWMTKEVMWSNLETPSQRAAIDLENRTQILSSMTKDHREAVHSFLDKRPPNFLNK
ncbi:enoyl-CoA hydratase [Rhodococcus sp. 14-2686-1-2]|nr:MULTISPECIES: enoyl-CoA hydratase-related protein [unclassified Rhodococcus (in: high G+C Gram-positive bacteria)]OZE90752.1 enoyl-CoA hydratase [Rhodococcus sp. 15-1189-1-1a]OZF07711.1 enoyl-CoA hydratase [Rhodococcus sp. 14-2686-1-2]